MVVDTQVMLLMVDQAALAVEQVEQLQVDQEEQETHPLYLLLKENLVVVLQDKTKVLVAAEQVVLEQLVKLPVLEYQTI